MRKNKWPAKYGGKIMDDLRPSTRAAWGNLGPEPLGRRSFAPSDLSPTERAPSGLRKLQADWDRKLKDSGFEDIEDRNAPGEPLRAWHSSYFQCRYTPEEFQAKREYFDLAQNFLHTGFFSDDLLDYFEIVDQDKRVWELHVEGHPIREIARQLRVSKYRIETVLSVLTERMMASR